MNPKTDIDRINYAKKFYSILVYEVDNNMKQLLQFSEQKCVHLMKALATLSKYLGCYNQWKRLRENYQLKWSGNNIDTFSHMVQTNIDSMIDWVKKTIAVLPIDYANLIIYNTLTGLRPNESIESLKLLKIENNNNYVNIRTMLYVNKLCSIKKKYNSIVEQSLFLNIKHDLNA